MPNLRRRNGTSAGRPLNRGDGGISSTSPLAGKRPRSPSPTTVSNRNSPAISRPPSKRVRFELDELPSASISSPAGGQASFDDSSNPAFQTVPLTALTRKRPRSPSPPPASPAGPSNLSAARRPIKRVKFGMTTLQWQIVSDDSRTESPTIAYTIFPSSTLPSSTPPDPRPPHYPSDTGPAPLIVEENDHYSSTHRSRSPDEVNSAVVDSPIHPSVDYSQVQTSIETHDCRVPLTASAPSEESSTPNGASGLDDAEIHEIDEDAVADELEDVEVDEIDEDAVADELENSAPDGLALGAAVGLEEEAKVDELEEDAEVDELEEDAEVDELEEDAEVDELEEDAEVDELKDVVTDGLDEHPEADEFQEATSEIVEGFPPSSREETLMIGESVAVSESTEGVQSPSPTSSGTSHSEVLALERLLAPPESSNLILNVTPKRPRSPSPPLSPSHAAPIDRPLPKRVKVAENMPGTVRLIESRHPSQRRFFGRNSSQPQVLRSKFNKLINSTTQEDLLARIQRSRNIEQARSDPSDHTLSESLSLPIQTQPEGQAPLSVPQLSQFNFVPLSAARPEFPHIQPSTGRASSPPQRQRTPQLEDTSGPAYQPPPVIQPQLESQTPHPIRPLPRRRQFVSPSAVTVTPELPQIQPPSGRASSPPQRQRTPQLEDTSGPAYQPPQRQHTPQLEETSGPGYPLSVPQLSQFEFVRPSVARPELPQIQPPTGWAPSPPQRQGTPQLEDTSGPAYQPPPVIQPRLESQTPYPIRPLPRRHQFVSPSADTVTPELPQIQPPSGRALSPPQHQHTPQLEDTSGPAHQLPPVIRPQLESQAPPPIPPRPWRSDFVSPSPTRQEQLTLQHPHWRAPSPPQHHIRQLPSTTQSQPEGQGPPPFILPPLPSSEFVPTPAVLAQPPVRLPPPPPPPPPPLTLPSQSRDPHQAHHTHLPPPASTQYSFSLPSSSTSKTGQGSQTKSKIARAVEHFQSLANNFVIGGPLHPGNHANITTANPGGENEDTVMLDPVAEDEDSRLSSRQKGKQKARPLFDDESEYYETYELLRRNPDAPCCNATMATVMELFAELKTSQIELQAAVVQPRLEQNRNSGGGGRGRSRGRARASPKTSYGIKHQDEADILLQQEVRQLTKELLKIAQEPLRVPTVQELRSFAQNPYAGGPQIDDLVLDLASKGLASPWNKRATSIFATKFLATKPYISLDRSKIEGAFDCYLQALQNAYKRQRVAESGDAPARIKQFDEAKRKARYARRINKRHRRCGTLESFDSVPGIKEIVDKMSKFPIDTMSGDESEDDENGERRIVSTRCEWRSEAADDLFEICDALDLSTRFQSDDTPNPGRFPVARIKSHRPDRRAPPTRLPENLYSDTFKANLTDDERLKLAMQPSFVFKFPPGLLRVAERYRHATERHLRPLPRNHPRLDVYRTDGTALSKEV